MIEMLVDWKAASERGKDRALADALIATCLHKGFDSQLTALFENTRKELDW